MNEELSTTPAPDHKKLIVLIIILGVIVIAAVLWSVIFRTNTPEQAVTIDPVAFKQAQLSASSYNPPANLTPQEIAAKEAQLKLPNPPANLTPQEIEAKRAVLEKI